MSWFFSHLFLSSQCITTHLFHSIFICSPSSVSAQFSLCRTRVFDDDSGVRCVSLRSDVREFIAVNTNGTAACVVDISAVAELRCELERIGAESVSVRRLVTTAEHAVTEMNKWEAAAQSLRDKLEPLQDTLKNYEEDPDIRRHPSGWRTEGEKCSGLAMAMKYVASGGELSVAMEHIFGKDLSESGIRRLLRSLATAFEETKERLNELREAAETLLFRCTTISALARLNDHLAEVLNPNDANILLEVASDLLAESDDAVAILAKTWTRYEAFCKWLTWECVQQAEFGGNGEDDYTNDQELVNVDLVLEFLQDEYHKQDRFEAYMNASVKSTFDRLWQAERKVFDRASVVLSERIQNSHRLQVYKNDHEAFRPRQARINTVRIYSVLPARQSGHMCTAELLTHHRT